MGVCVCADCWGYLCQALDYLGLALGMMVWNVDLNASGSLD